VLHLAGFCLLFAVGLAYSVGSFDPYDEAWFLAVVARVRDGESLYRDVWYGAGPLPVWVADAVSWVVGVEIIAVKIVVVAAFAAAAMVAWLVASRLGLALVPRLLLLAGMAYFGRAIQLSAYGPLAVPFVLATLLAALIWQERRAVGPRGGLAAAVLGGAAAGFAFSSKQNVGLYALAALIAVFAVQEVGRPRKLVVAIAQGVAGFVAAAFLAVLPALLSGGFSTYIHRGFTGKTTYLQYSSLSYSNALHTYARSWSAATETRAEETYWATSILLPLLAVVALIAIAAAWRRLDARAIPVVAFALVGFASLYPLGDAPHVVTAAAPMLVACAYALHVWSPSAPVGLRRVVTVAIAVVLVPALLLSLARPLRLARSTEANLSSLPHMHGAFDEVAREARFARDARVLAAAGRRDGRLFLLMPDAGFRYLTSGLRNPTAYDYPIVTTFGPTGQQGVIRQLASSRISRTCFGWWTAGLLPVRLVSYVRTTMKRGADLGPCALYSR